MKASKINLKFRNSEMFQAALHLRSKHLVQSRDTVNTITDKHVIHK